MTTRIAFLFLILLSFAACQPSVSNSESAQETDSLEPKDPAPKAVVTDEMIEAEREAQLAIRMAEEELDFFARERLGANQFPPGEWLDQDGVRTCIGFLTRNADQDFCAAEIPADWVPFEFNNQTYYFQPLSESSE